MFVVASTTLSDPAPASGLLVPARIETERLLLRQWRESDLDAYAAMVSERPYSVAMRPSRALEELRRGAGSQFDPRVVAAFGEVAAQRGQASHQLGIGAP